MPLSLTCGNTCTTAMCLAHGEFNILVGLGDSKGMLKKKKKRILVLLPCTSYKTKILCIVRKMLISDTRSTSKIFVLPFPVLSVCSI